ncbi:hypothetical protein BGW36DRAFT_429812 [Talaromyces proteolyticus]|uniref:Uncharacterized protein n=1 Tax=Talaromyces proteolyticus TaxID=1131652 RepID=A0AAD4KJJ4_9EURO|nr:uncharacterized protein BGW36DRAFT_429812 [Talaromyces proteolyticus]KAH8693781.1 hypothetical protein BGW36DRAFT_429812 [Talaromyces proteolyticus]
MRPERKKSKHLSDKWERKSGVLSLWACITRSVSESSQVSDGRKEASTKRCSAYQTGAVWASGAAEERGFSARRAEFGGGDEAEEEEEKKKKKGAQRVEDRTLNE